MNDTKIIKRLLAFAIIVLVFYVLKVLSFIFIPLFSAIFIALLFMPMMRWFEKRNVHQAISVTTAALIVAGSIFGATQLIKLTGNQISKGKEDFMEKVDAKLESSALPINDMLGVNLDMDGEKSVAKQLMESEKVSKWAYENFGITLGFVQRLVSTILLMLFFMLLLLAGSLNVQKLLETLIFNRKNSSVKAFKAIEKSIVKFLKVKTLTSTCTGLGFGLTCYFFDVSFALFWGLIAFALNYIQMIGSVVATIVLTLFAYIELSTTGSLLGFALILTGVQVLFGGVLEPIFMGKSFRINTITVLIMLMLWGYIWGGAGLILSIPITVMLKIIFEKFSNTQFLDRIMS